MSGDALALVCADILDGIGQPAGAATLRWPERTPLDAAEALDEAEREVDAEWTRAEDLAVEVVELEVEIRRLKGSMCAACKVATS